jgi:hypothetical protein
LAPLWARSQFAADVVYQVRPAQTSAGPGFEVWIVSSERGCVVGSYYRSLGMDVISTPASNARAGRWGLHWSHYLLHRSQSAEPPPGLWRRLGFGYFTTFSKSQFDDARRASVPYWLPVSIFAVMPAVAAARHLRRARRLHSGLCPRCGYDLRATPHRCPECGAGVPA